MTTIYSCEKVFFIITINVIYGHNELTRWTVQIKEVAKINFQLWILYETGQGMFSLIRTAYLNEPMPDLIKRYFMFNFTLFKVAIPRGI